MAWKPYIDNMLSSGLQIAGIYGLEGGAWAESDNFKASQGEMAAVISGIKGQSFPNGVTINGTRYTVITYSPDSVTCKARGAAEDKNFLVHVAMAKTCVVSGGICGSNERSTTIHVENIRDYLAKSGY